MMKTKRYSVLKKYLHSTWCRWRSRSLHGFCDICEIQWTIELLPSYLNAEDFTAVAKCTLLWRGIYIDYVLQHLM